MNPYLRPTILLILLLGSLAAALTNVSAQSPRLDANQYRINRLAPGVLNDQAIFHIDQANNINVEIIASVGGIQTSILGPTGQLIDPNTVSGLGGTFQISEVAPQQGPLILPTLTAGFHYVYTFPSLGVGDYTVRFQAGSPPAGEIPIFTQITTDSKITTSFLTTESVITLGNPVVLSLAVFNTQTPVPGATVPVIVKGLSGTPVNLTLLDDGGTSDGAAGDGLYSGEFTPTKLGKHVALAKITGSVGGVAFSREATTDFMVVPQPTTLTGVVSDRGADDNGNGLFDRVVVSAGVNATIASKHRLFARLKTPSGAIIASSAEMNLLPGIQNIEVSFEASAFTSLGAIGPYTVDSLELDIIGTDGETPTDRLFNVGTTRAYQLSQFEQLPLSFVGVTSTQGEDTNANGLFDKLVVMAQVKTVTAGQYSWSFKLTDQSRNEIDFTSGSGSLVAGLNTIRFEFKGSAIGAFGVNGPYLLRDLLLFGATSSLVQSDAGQTPVFQANQFEGFNPNISNLAITQTASPNPVSTAANITYVLTITNTGPRNAPSVTVTDNLPGSTTFVSCSATGGGVCGGSGNNRTVTFATLNTGASETVTIVAAVNNGITSAITNTATVASTASDPDTANNTATATVQVAGSQVTVQTNPAGRSFNVDGITYNSTQTFSWSAGSTHTIGTTAIQAGSTGTQYVWSNWTDLGAITHTVAPSSSITYTANFTTQYLLTMNAGAGGTVTPQSGYFTSGTEVNILATPNAGFTFGGWVGTGSGSVTTSTNAAIVTMSGPVSETASFVNTAGTFWKNAVGVLVTGNSITKTAPDGWGSGGASSTATIALGDGYVEFTATETNKDRMAGLSNGDTNQDYADIDFAVDLTPGGIAWVFESGVSRGVYALYQAGDRFHVGVEGGVVKYRKNGTLFYTSNVVPVYPLVLDTSLNSNGATISGAALFVGPPTEDVVWTNQGGVSASGNNLMKTAADGWGNAGASSTKGIASGDGFTEFKATETNKDRMAGLSNGDTNKEYSDIDFAINLAPGGVAWVFEAGISRGVNVSYQASDSFRVAVEGGVVKYRKNGTLFYTSNVVPLYPLVIDTSLYSTGATVTSAVLSGNLQPVGSTSLSPTVTTTAATSVTSTSAVLNGNVNPNGLATTAWFEWGTDQTLAVNTQTPSQAIGSAAGNQAIAANLSALPSGTHYFRAVASNSVGQTKGSILSFTAGGPTTEAVVWNNAQGVSVSGNNLTKTAGDGWGNAGASSTKGIGSGDGYVECTATETNKDRMCGLSNGDTNKEYSDLDFAIDIAPGGIAWIFESGVGRGVYTQYQAGDRFRIAVEGGVVKYRKNGTLFYTSNVVPVYPLLLDTSLNSNGATITNAMISGNLQTLVATQENVIWTNTFGVSVSGNSLTKTAADGWTNAGAVSTRAIPSGDGYVEFKATETNKDRMAGLSKGDTNQNFSDIDFAVNLSPGGVAWIFESGVSRGVYTNYQAGDTFRVAVEGGVVKYSKNGGVFYVSSVAPAYPLLVDTSLYSTGATVTSAVVFAKF